MWLFCLIPLDLLIHCGYEHWQLPHPPELAPLSFNHPEPKVSGGQGVNGPFICAWDHSSDPGSRTSISCKISFSHYSTQPILPTRLLTPSSSLLLPAIKFLFLFFKYAYVYVSLCINFLAPHTIHISSLLFQHLSHFTPRAQEGRLHTVQWLTPRCLLILRCSKMSRRLLQN